MKKIFVIACVLMIWAAPAVADVVVDWNVITAQTAATGAASDFRWEHSDIS